MSEQKSSPPHQFSGYPQVREGPKVPYQKSKDENPVLRGMPLVAGAWLSTKFSFILKMLYSNAGFTTLQQIQHLNDYDERWDPTVIPLSQGESQYPTLDAKSFPILPNNIPGRYYSIADYHALYLSGELTPLAVVESLLPFIQRDLEPASHHSTAFIDAHPKELLEAARESTARYKTGKPLSIFDGVPAGVKDEVNVRGYRTTSGRKLNTDLFPVQEKSCWPVLQWEEGGGIVLGKLNMHEIGADTTNLNPNWGTPLNPHNDKYYTGGSSGGSAYAVAAGLVPVALGLDGGGSIRIPASFCGLYGLKPSHGRIDNTSSTLTVLGPIAATMSDLTAFYQILSKPNPSEPICTLFASSSFSKPNFPRKIGFPKDWFEQADPSVYDASIKALDYYTQKLGYELIDIEIPYLPQAQLAHAFTFLAEAYAKAKAKTAPGAQFTTDYLPAQKILLGVGSQVTGYDYHLAQRLRNLLMKHLAFLFKEHPGLLIVTPASPIPGWPIGTPGDLTYGASDGNLSIKNMTYVWLANFTGCPAISIPIGYVDPVQGEGKVPLGLMAMGDWGAEDQLLEWGREGEAWLNEVYEGGRVRPSNWEDVVKLARDKMTGGN